MLKKPNKLTRKAIEYQKTGSSSAFDYVVKRLDTWLFRAAYRVHFIFNLYDGYQADIEDCRQELLLYMVRALRTFDPSRGYQFLSHLLRLHAEYGVINRSSNFHQFNIPRAVIERGCDMPAARPMVEANQKNCGWHEAMQEHMAEVSDQYLHVSKGMEEVLSDREFTFLMLRSRGVTLKEVATMAEISKQRVQQIEAKSYAKVRDLFFPKPDDQKLLVAICDSSQERVPCGDSTTLV